jgi:predicted transcriptional regulator
MTQAPSQQTTSLEMDSEMRVRVRRLAEACRRSAHWVMREAIAEYVEREERREQFRADAEAARAQFEETGLHATQE